MPTTQNLLQLVVGVSLTAAFPLGSACAKTLPPQAELQALLKAGVGQHQRT